MPIQYNQQDVSEFVTNRLESGKKLTDKDVAIIKNMMAAIVEFQGECLFLRRELNIVGGDIAEISGTVQDAGIGIENVLSEFKPGRNSFTGDELREVVSFVQSSVKNFNAGLDVFVGVVSKLPLLF